MAVESGAAAPTPRETTIKVNPRQRWLVLGTLFVIMVFVLGGTATTVPIFFTPLTKQYGWSHSRTSMLITVFVLMLGLIAPVAGWLCDRLEARVVISVGAAMTAAGLVWSSLTHSFWPMFAAWLLIGAGVAISTLVPSALVAANWFADNRGLAIAATVSGTGVGGVILPPLTDYLIRNFSISTAFFILALPIVLIVIPLVILVIRTRPPGTAGATVAQQAANLAGLDVAAAVRTLPFWMLCTLQAAASVGLAACFYHTVPFLIHAGYAPQHAALLQSAVTAVGVPGNLLVGLLVDRFTGRRVLPFALMALAATGLLLLGAGGGANWMLYATAFVIVFGITAGLTSTVTPVAVVETMGLRRFGSLWGLVGLASTIGLCGGTMLVGWVFDVTASYSAAFELGAAFTFFAALTAFMVSPAEGVGALPAGALPRAH